MEKQQEKQISKKMSYALRHRPDSIGIHLDKQGWTNIDILLEKLGISRAQLAYVVSNNSKQRFAISDDNQRIRANQGHSVKIDLGLKKKVPPVRLYHGTIAKHYDQIKRQGLLKMNRHHVHLSTDIETAKQVGARHGKPIILVIDCKAMYADKLDFYQSDNGVWLTESVAPKYISVM